MSPDTQRLTTLEARLIINQINKMNLDMADYEYLKKLINKLILGISFSGYMPHKNGYRFYRGVRFGSKPMTTNELQYPPKNLVTDFQRCNPPEKPMFYCSLSPLVVYKELNVVKGDVIYLSRWSIKNNFSFIPIGNLSVDDDYDDRTAMILSFFETKFLTPVHQTYSSQYKVTSAITEVLSTGDINISADIFKFETNQCA